MVLLHFQNLKWTSCFDFIRCMPPSLAVPICYMPLEQKNNMMVYLAVVYIVTVKYLVCTYFVLTVPLIIYKDSEFSLSFGLLDISRVPIMLFYVGRLNCCLPRARCSECSDSPGFSLFLSGSFFTGLTS